VEGEGIAFEVMDVVRAVNPYAEFKRAWFSSLDKGELLEAFRNLREPNKRLADKCFARSIIDLTVGASFTRLLTLKVREVESSALPKGHFISYGPCQSPTLYFVVKRAIERESFQSQRFYRVVAKLKVGDRVLEVEHAKGRFGSKEEAEEVMARAGKATTAEVEDVRATKAKKGAPQALGHRRAREPSEQAPQHKGQEGPRHSRRALPEGPHKLPEDRDPSVPALGLREVEGLRQPPRVRGLREAVAGRGGQAYLGPQGR
jgi:hypothetical protein